MQVICDRTESDSDSGSDSEDNSAGELDGWEVAVEEKEHKITNQVIDFVSRKISLDFLFSKYKIYFQEKYSPSGWKFYRNCPFPDHRDSDPSFNYNPEDDRFFCFGCNRGGRSVHFMAYMENISVTDAANRMLSWISDTDDLYIDIKDSYHEDIDDLLYEFSNDIRGFLIKHGTQSLDFVEKITWALDMYLHKNIPSDSVSKANLEQRLNFLRRKLNDYR